LTLTPSQRLGPGPSFSYARFSGKRETRGDIYMEEMETEAGKFGRRKFL